MLQGASVANDTTGTSTSLQSIQRPRWIALARGAAPYIGLAIATIAILIWRRPDQLLYPYVWVEEGTITLPAYLHHGWLSLFYPVAGYLVLPSKLIFLLAATLSFAHLPELTYWLTVAFTFVVVASVARCPTYLRWPTVCALAVLLLPTDAEVFAVSEYAFWWGIVLLFVSLLWRREARKTPLRATLTALGGLSSPLVIPLAAIFLVRACLFRTKREYTILGIAVATAAVQATCLLVTGNVSHDHGHAIANFNVPMLVEKFFGWFVFWSRHSHVGLWSGALIGTVVIVMLTVATFRNRAKLNIGVLFLAGCLLVAIAASIARAPLASIHPVLAGPRYFFLPYILLAWLLIQTAQAADSWERIVVAVLMLSALHQTLLYGRRYQDPINWQAEVRACTASDKPFNLPIQFDGSRARVWHVTLNGGDCRELLSRSFF